MIGKGAAICCMALAYVLYVPEVAFGQQGSSGIAGTVKDASGGVLPGVTVEAASPALIERVRSAVTDTSGSYRITGLRPGTYTVTFVLPGFTTLKRDGLVLEADFTAPMDVELRVGALEETVVVSGASPLVDVQNTQRREVLTRDVLDALPTGRNYQSIGATLPAVNQGRFDVGGSTAMQQGSLTVYGSSGNDFQVEIDGMSVSASLSSGSCACVYHNDGAYENYIYQVAGGTAENSSGGVRVNMIPREGGNQFRFSSVNLFANNSMQSVNANDDLKARGLETPAKLAKLFDVNNSLGGPIKRSRIWFFLSMRQWAYNNQVANALNPDGSQAVDDNLIQAYTARITAQLSQNNKLTVMYDKLPKERKHRDLEILGVEPKATVQQLTPLAYNDQIKWTSTMTPHLLVEAGLSTNFYIGTRFYQPEVKRPTATDPFGDVAKVDLITGTRRNAGLEELYRPFIANNFVTSASYVTGTHTVKVGMVYRWGWIREVHIVNGDMIQRYRNGVPDSVQVFNTPIERSDVSLKGDVGVYVQDSWKMKRLTLNPGIRVEWLNEQIEAQRAPGGRFVGFREFEAVKNVPNWKDVVPRLGAAYDLFGTGKTAIKGSLGRYMQQDATSFASQYNPLVMLNEIRTWTDRNGDDLAQLDEIGPSAINNFGTRSTRNPAPDIQRPYQLLYNLGAQHEIRPGLSVSANYFRRSYYNQFWTDNLLTTHNDYTLVRVPDPRGNGLLDIYNLNVNKRGLVEQLDSNSANQQIFNGVDFGFSARLPRGTLAGGTSTGRLRTVNCEVDDPNLLRFCDQTKLDMPFRTTLKVSGSYELAYGVRLSGVFASVPGEDRPITYLVNRTIVPNLTLAQVSVRLNEPYSVTYDRANQMDFSVSKVFQSGKVRIKPQIDFFNVTNTNVVIDQINTFGSSLDRVRNIYDPRLVRIGVQVDF
jgi:hypothetical protein